MINVSVIIMASGHSSRMGTNKLLLKFKQKTFLEHTLSLVDQINFFERILVISPENRKQIVIPKTITVVENVESKVGQSVSVRLGTKAASGEGYLYMTIDQPRLDTKIINQLLEAGTKETIVFPTDENGKPSSPVFFGADFRSELLEVVGETGGRTVRNNHPEAWNPIKITESDRLLDIDTVKDYQELIKYYN